MFKSEWEKLLAVSLLAVLAIFAFSFLFFTAGFKPTYFVEQGLEKNAEFSLRPGDTLVYEAKYNNRTERATFIFGRKALPGSNISRMVYDNCTLAAIQGANASTCIRGDGRDWDSNQTLSSPVFFFFSPWMLALSENFTWNASVRNGINGEPIQDFSARVGGTGSALGRSAYAVLVREEGIFGVWERKMWIDSKSRILLKEEGENYTVTLIQAPFPLQQ